MKKWEFNKSIDWLIEQKKRETEEVEKTRNQPQTSSAPTGKMKYLGL